MVNVKINAAFQIYYHVTFPHGMLAWEKMKFIFKITPLIFYILFLTGMYKDPEEKHHLLF